MSDKNYLPGFALKVIGKLRRFDECASDFESGGVDIGRHWLDMLTQLGLLNRVQRSPALWEITQQGEDLLESQTTRAPDESVYGPYLVKWIGAGVWAGITDELPPELEGSEVYVQRVIFTDSD